MIIITLLITPQDIIIYYFIALLMLIIDSDDITPRRLSEMHYIDIDARLTLPLITRYYAIDCHWYYYFDYYCHYWYLRHIVAIIDAPPRADDIGWYYW